MCLNNAEKLSRRTFSRAIGILSYQHSVRCCRYWSCWGEWRRGRRREGRENRHQEAQSANLLLLNAPPAEETQPTLNEIWMMDHWSHICEFTLVWVTFFIFWWFVGGLINWIIVCLLVQIKFSVVKQFQTILNHISMSDSRQLIPIQPTALYSPTLLQQWSPFSLPLIPFTPFVSFSLSSQCVSIVISY